MNIVNDKKKGLKQKILHELIKYWLIVLYMAIFFGAFTSYRRLLLAHYGISYEDYGISVIRALVLAKVVLVAETFRLGRGYEEKPLVIPTLYKTFLFTLCVAAYDIAEGLVRGLIGGLGPMGALDEVTSRFNYELLSRAQHTNSFEAKLMGRRVILPSMHVQRVVDGDGDDRNAVSDRRHCVARFMRRYSLAQTNSHAAIPDAQNCQ